MDERATTFGKFVRQKRESIRLPLRKTAAEAGIDPGNLSRYERDALPAPQDQSVLSRLAAALRLEKGSEEYRAFLDLAALSAGRIPPDLAADPDLVARLPILFRVARKGKITRETLLALAKKIRGA